MRRAIKTKEFLIPAVLTLCTTGIFFGWQLGYVARLVWSLPRPTPTGLEISFAIVLTILLSCNIGLFYWHNTHGGCPIGAKRASGIAGMIGAIALICPACIALPATLFGAGIILAALGPFIPLLQIISLFLLLVSTIMLWPKKR